jgi:hypothetical protein
MKNIGGKTQPRARKIQLQPLENRCQRRSRSRNISHRTLVKSELSMSLLSLIFCPY